MSRCQSTTHLQTIPTKSTCKSLGGVMQRKKSSPTWIPTFPTFQHLVSTPAPTAQSRASSNSYLAALELSIIGLSHFNSPCSKSYGWMTWIACRDKHGPNLCRSSFPIWEQRSEVEDSKKCQWSTGFPTVTRKEFAKREPNLSWDPALPCINWLLQR